MSHLAVLNKRSEIDLILCVKKILVERTALIMYLQPYKNLATNMDTVQCKVVAEWIKFIVKHCKIKHCKTW